MNAIKPILGKVEEGDTVYHLHRPGEFTVIEFLSVDFVILTDSIGNEIPAKICDLFNPTLITNGKIH